MTEQEAIERIYSKLMDGTPKDKDACDIAIDAFEKKLSLPSNGKKA